MDMEQKPDHYRNPIETAPDIADLFEEGNFDAINYILAEIEDRTKAMELAADVLRSKGKSELADKCLPWLLEELKRQRDTRPAVEEVLRDLGNSDDDYDD